MKSEALAFELLSWLYWLANSWCLPPLGVALKFRVNSNTYSYVLQAFLKRGLSFYNVLMYYSVVLEESFLLLNDLQHTGGCGYSSKGGHHPKETATRLGSMTHCQETRES